MGWGGGGGDGEGPSFVLMPWLGIFTLQRTLGAAICLYQLCGCGCCSSLRIFNYLVRKMTQKSMELVNIVIFDR